MSTRPAATQETSPEGSTPPVRLPVGSVVADRYVVISVLGSGGMGTVYRVRHRATRREVALKVLHASLHDRPRALRRFEREAQALAEVTHPHITPTLDAGVDAVTGVRFQTTALLDGQSLREIIQHEAPLDVERALRLVLPVLYALEAVHAAGIVHRDVKPENILVTEGADGPHPWLLDFGICKRDDGDTLDTPGDALVGTPAYMSPEQAAGDVGVDVRADVWAAGAVLYELLTGCPPFNETLPGKLLARILTEDAQPVSALRPDLSPALARCVDLSLARDRARRHPTARAFAEALLRTGHIVSRSPSVAPPPSSDIDARRAAVTITAPTLTPRIAPKRRGALLFAIIAALVAGSWIVARSAPRTEAPRAEATRAVIAPGPTLPAERPQTPLLQDAARPLAIDAAVSAVPTPTVARDRAPPRRPRRETSPVQALHPYEIE